MPDSPSAHKPPVSTDQDPGAEALDTALSGSDGGSDTRAGSLRGGSASGSDIDPDQETINAALKKQGRAAAANQTSDTD